MDNIVDIAALIPHRVSEVICIKCGKRWVAVRPDKVLLKNLECQNCGPGFVIETGQTVEDDWDG